MDGLCRPTGAGGVVRLGASTLRLAPLTLRGLGLIEAHLLQQRREAYLRAMLAVRDSMPAEMWSREWLDAQDDTVDAWPSIPQAELLTWLDTREGMAFSLWLMLGGHNSGEFSLANIEAIIDQMSNDDFAIVKLARDQAATLDRISLLSDWQQSRPANDRPGRRQRKPAPFNWRRYFHKLVLSEWAGGLGMDPETVKNLTWYEARLYTSDEQSLGGPRKLSSAEFRAATGRTKRPGGPKKVLDAKARSGEMAAEFFRSGGDTSAG